MSKSKRKSKRKQVEFSFLEGEKVIGRFDGGDISGFGGAVILRELELMHDLIAGAAQCIKDTRDPAKVIHTVFHILCQRIFLICLGFPDANDSNKFSKDAIIKLVLGILPGKTNNDRRKAAASQSTISRMESGRKKSKKQIENERKQNKSKGKDLQVKAYEKGVSENDIRRLFSYYIERYIQRLSKKKPKMIVLDFDGSAVEAHGHQQYIAFNGHYEMNMYFPLFVFDQDGWLIAPILRPGNQSEAEIATPVLKILVKRIRKKLPGVTIVFRGDAGFHSQEIFRWCEANDVYYVIGIKGDSNLHSKSKTQDKKAREQFSRLFGEPSYTGKNGSKEKSAAENEAHTLPKDQRMDELEEIYSREVRLFCAFWHRADSAANPDPWDVERMVIARSVFNDRGLHRRYLVTNLTNLTAEHIYTKIYSRRGRMEQMICSMKEIGCERMSCQEYLANQFRLLLHGLSYNLFQLLRDYLPKSARNQKEITLSEKFLRIAVQVKFTTRQIWLRWTSNFPEETAFMHLCSRLNLLYSTA